MSFKKNILFSNWTRFDSYIFMNFVWDTKSSKSIIIDLDHCVRAKIACEIAIHSAVLFVTVYIRCMSAFSYLFSMRTMRFFSLNFIMKMLFIVQYSNESLEKSCAICLSYRRPTDFVIRLFLSISYVIHISQYITCTLFTHSYNEKRKREKKKQWSLLCIAYDLIRIWYIHISLEWWQCIEMPVDTSINVMRCDGIDKVEKKWWCKLYIYIYIWCCHTESSPNNRIYTIVIHHSL